MKCVFFLLLVAGCHSSCDESSGAAPVVVEADAAAEPVLGQGRGIQTHRSMSMRPHIMQQNTATPAAPASTTP